MIPLRVLGTLSCALLTLALLRAPVQAGEPRIAPDAPLRAAIIINIIRFVEFGTGNDDEPLLLCVSRSSGAARAIAALDGQRVGSRPIAHRDFDGTDASGCEVAYLGASNTGAIGRIRRAGMLVIGDGPGFIEAGGTIGLVGVGNQLRFEANTRAARDARIKLSSKLLRLATRVR